jgi:hypothetical protein
MIRLKKIEIEMACCPRNFLLNIDYWFLFSVKKNYYYKCCQKEKDFFNEEKKNIDFKLYKTFS